MTGIAIRRWAVLFLTLGLGLPGAGASERSDPDFPPRSPLESSFRSASRRGAASFEVRASRLGLSTTRHVEVVALVEGSSGTLRVRLDRPIALALGVREVAFRVELTDGAGALVDVLCGTIEDGGESLEIPFRLPGDGRYVMTLREESIHAGRARVRLRPAAAVSLELPPAATVVAGFR